jgi:hypothetical protein
MVVRVRWQPPAIGAIPLRSKEIALLFASLLAPSALIAFTLAGWIVASELRWTGEFFASEGLLSHWQFWLCIAAVLLGLARVLERYSRGE